MNQSNSSQNRLLFNLVREGILKKIHSAVIMTVTVFTTIILSSVVSMNYVYAGNSSHSNSNNYSFHSTHSPLLKTNGHSNSSNSYATTDYISLKTKNTLIPLSAHHNSRNYSTIYVNNNVHSNSHNNLHENKISFNVSNYLTALANSHNTSRQNLDYPSKIDASSNTFDLRNLNVSKYKIATMHVLSDLCPHLLSKKQKAVFSRAFDAKFNNILPESNNPKEIFRNLYTQKDYRLILTKMKNNHHNFSEIENKALCEDIVDYKY